MADPVTWRGLSREWRRQALAWPMVALAALFAVACAPPSATP